MIEGRWMNVDKKIFSMHHWDWIYSTAIPWTQASLTISIRDLAYVFHTPLDSNRCFNVIV